MLVQAYSLAAVIWGATGADHLLPVVIRNPKRSQESEEELRAPHERTL